MSAPLPAGSPIASPPTLSGPVVVVECGRARAKPKSFPNIVLAARFLFEEYRGPIDDIEVQTGSVSISGVKLLEAYFAIVRERKASTQRADAAA